MLSQLDGAPKRKDARTRGRKGERERERERERDTHTVTHTQSHTEVEGVSPSFSGDTLPLGFLRPLISTLLIAIQETGRGSLVCGLFLPSFLLSASLSSPESDQIAPQRGRESDHRWSAGIHLKYVSVTITGYILEKPSKRTPLTL